MTIERQVGDKHDKASRTRISEFQGVIKIVEAKGGDFISEVTVDKLVENNGSNSVVLAEPGTIITVKEISGEKFYLGADPKVQRTFGVLRVGLATTRPQRCSDEQMLAPPGPVRMGDTWRADGACGAELAQKLSVDSDCMTNLLVKFAGITNLHGVECARLEIPMKCSFHKVQSVKTTRGSRSADVTAVMEGCSVMFYPLHGDLGELRTESVSRVHGKAIPVFGPTELVTENTIYNQSTSEYHRLE